MENNKELLSSLSSRNKKPYLFVATPMYGGLCYGEYVLEIMQLYHKLNSNGINMRLMYTKNDSLVTRARNDLVHAFLKTDATHLLFIDADVSFNHEDVIKMIEEDKELIAGIYPKKNINWNNVREGFKNNWNINKIASDYVFIGKSAEDCYIDFDSKELKEVTYVGTGFMMIKREVFEKLKDKVNTYINNTLYPGESTYSFFETSIDKKDKVLLAEDYHFCNLCTENGTKIYVAPWAWLKHTGNYTFG